MIDVGVHDVARIGDERVGDPRENPRHDLRLHVGERRVSEHEDDGCDRRRRADADLPEAPDHAHRQESEVQAQGDVEHSPVRKGREPVCEVVGGRVRPPRGHRSAASHPTGRSSTAKAVPRAAAGRRR